jgi:hypothetical protein
MILLAVSAPLSAGKNERKPVRVGIVENQYDHVEKLLQKYKIDYTMIKYRDLEKEQLYSQLDALFIPCGAEPPLTSSVNIMSRGTHLEGVTLNDQYYKIDMTLTGKYLRQFVENGGSAYFSDFSFKYLQDATSSFSFFKDFPYIGLAGQLKVQTRNDLACYIQGSVYVEMGHSGWVVPSEIRNAETVLTAECETPLGMKPAPVAALVTAKQGVALFTSYHNENDPFSLMRYFILRTVYKRELDESRNYILKWEQTPLSSIVDKSLGGETARQYRLTVKNDGSYLYFKSESGLWQIDIFDGKGMFLYSKDSIRGDFHYFVPSRGSKEIIVKILPLDNAKYNVYTAATAGGFRIFPYYLRILIGGIGFILLAFYLRFLKQQRFRGRVRTYETEEPHPEQ